MDFEWSDHSPSYKWALPNQLKTLRTKTEVYLRRENPPKKWEHLPVALRICAQGHNYQLWISSLPVCPTDFKFANSHTCLSQFLKMSHWLPLHICLLFCFSGEPWLIQGLTPEAASAWHVPKFQDPRRKAGLQHEPHWLYRRFRHRQPLFPANGGNRPRPHSKYPFPNARQGPAWWAGLSKNKQSHLLC